MRIVLASGSPRRRDLLESIGLGFEVRPPDIQEIRHPDESPSDFVERMAREKAESVDAPGSLVIAADTVVVFRGRILGKPGHPSEARAMLESLSGESHTVLTGVAVRTGDECRVHVESSSVRFSELTSDEIARYVDTGEPMDKAGAYALQGVGALFVESVSGSPSNVIGLPLAPLAQLLRSVGVELIPGP